VPGRVQKQIRKASGGRAKQSPSPTVRFARLIRIAHLFGQAPDKFPPTEVTELHILIHQCLPLQECDIQNRRRQGNFLSRVRAAAMGGYPCLQMQQSSRYSACTSSPSPCDCSNPGRYTATELRRTHDTDSNRVPPAPRPRVYSCLNVLQRRQGYSCLSSLRRLQQRDCLQQIAHSTPDVLFNCHAFRRFRRLLHPGL